MTNVPSPSRSRKSARRQIRKVLWITLVANLAVAGGKLSIGFLTGTLSMVADGFHSTLDASSNVIGLMGNALAARPPDDDHPYGHRRFETVAAMAIGAILLATAVEIAQQAIERVRTGGEPEISAVNFAVMIGTIVVNIAVSRYERREGKRLKSEILLADAANTGADVFVSLSVLASLVAVSLGWLWADIVAAFVVVVLIGKAAWEVLWQTGRVLVDTAPLSPEIVTELVEQIPDVISVRRVRSRGPADAMLLDITVLVAPSVTAEHAQSIGNAIKSALQEEIEGIFEVDVHCLPHYAMPPDYRLIARAEADALGLSIHEVVMFDTPDGSVLEMHVEVPPEQMLEEAHSQVTFLEQRVKQAVPILAGIISHIEPSRRGPVPIARSERAGKLRNQALDLALGLYPDVNWHEVFIRPEAHGYALSMHGGVTGEMTVEEAHLLAERTETHLRAALPLLQRVTIHTEPATVTD
jgi:cation diffusion facilitator family transporter